MIFAIFDEGIFLNISKEKSAKGARKKPQVFLSTLRIGSLAEELVNEFFSVSSCRELNF